MHLLFEFTALSLSLSHTIRCVFAPWRVLKQHGIKGPRPLPFLGNYCDFARVVILADSVTVHAMMVACMPLVCNTYAYML